MSVDDQNKLARELYAVIQKYEERVTSVEMYGILETIKMDMHDAVISLRNMVYDDAKKHEEEETEQH
jgi:hypothetical protein